MRKRIQVWLLMLGLLCGLLTLTARDTAYAMAELELFPIRITDPMINNLDAFGMLVPGGWAYDGQVVWDFQTIHQASFSMRLTGTDGATGVEHYPIVWHTWAPDQGIGGPHPFLGFDSFPEGSNYLGTIVLRPLSAADYLGSQVIAVHRPGAQIVGQAALPGLAQEVLNLNPPLPGTTVQADAARVRVQYVENGVLIEEDFYTALVYSRTPIGLNYWPQGIYSLRAPQGQLDARTGLLHALVRSTWIEPLWFANLLIVRDLFAQGQLQQIMAAGALSRQLAANAEEISAMQMAAWEETQNTLDRVFDSISDTIRGTEDFVNPFTNETVELPNTFENVWVSANETYVFSNDALFNPNLGDTIEWRLLSPMAP